MLYRTKSILFTLLLVAAWPLAASAQCVEGDLSCCVTDTPGAGTCELTAMAGEFPRPLTFAECGSISGVTYPDGVQLSPASECKVCGQGGTASCVVWSWNADCATNPDHFTFMVPNEIPILGAAPGPSNIYAPGAGDNKGVGAFMASDYAIRVNSANDNANPLLVTPAASTDGTSVVASFGRTKEACELGFADELVNTFVPVNPVTVYNFKGCTIEFTSGSGGTITGGACHFLDPNDPSSHSQQSNGVPFSELDVKFGQIPLGLTQAVIPGLYIGSGDASCVTFEYNKKLYSVEIDDGLPGC